MWLRLRGRRSLFLHINPEDSERLIFRPRLLLLSPERENVVGLKELSKKKRKASRLKHSDACSEMLTAAC